MTPAQAAALGLTKKQAAKFIPSEEDEQIIVCRWLDLNRIRYFAVPNGGGRSKRTAGRLKASGVKSGVCDLVIVDAPTLCPKVAGADRQHICSHPRTACPLHAVAVGLEMKRSIGGRLAPEQREWMLALESRGWLCLVANGADDAIKQLTALGYNRRVT